MVTDASHANESEEMIINEMTSLERHRSQGARMVFLTDGALWKGTRVAYIPSCGRATSCGGYVAPPYRQRPTHFKQVWRTVTC